MTDQPDTAAIRAALAAGIYVDYHDGLALCDALDAARAERARWEHDYWRELARAEAAEADLARAVTLCGEQARRAEYLQARIAAALEIAERMDGPWVVEDIKRALTGGTE